MLRKMILGMAALVLGAGSASAQPVHFAAKWAAPASSARLVATFDLDVAALANPGNNDGGFGTVLTNLRMRAYGTQSGDGMWSQSDFNHMAFNWITAVNPTIEWVGQPQAGGQWGIGTLTDFNLFANTSPDFTPTASFYNLMGVPGFQYLNLTSFAPATLSSGACFSAAGTCTVVSEADCLIDSGNFQGVGSTCEPAVTMHSTTSSTCSATQSLTVTIDTASGPPNNIIAGGQFFIGWDPRLVLSSVSAGDGLSVIYSGPDGDGQAIAVGIPDGGALVNNQTMVTLAFDVVVGQTLSCSTTSLVYFRTTDIPSRLTDNEGNDLNATMTGLAPLSGNITGPVFPGFEGVGFNADPGSCSIATQTLPAIIATDSCGQPVAALPSIDGTAITFPYPFPAGDTTVTWTAIDACGNSSTTTQAVSVASSNTMTVTLELDGSPAGSFTRCIQFGLYSGGGCPPVQTFNTDVVFSGGVGTATFSVPCGNFDAITATDPLHTLRRTGTLGSSNFAISGGAYVVDFTAASLKPLLGGNFNNDRYIDILDFGGYSGRFGQHPDVNASACGYAADFRNPDFNSDGNVDAADFTFIQFNFLKRRDIDPCGTPLAEPGPVTDISVADLVAQGMRDLAMADYNLDGRLNNADIDWVSQHGLPRCAADFNDDQTVDVQDVFSYINAWFIAHPKADVNASGQTDVQDIFSFLSGWFAGCN